MAARIPEPDEQALAVSHELAERIREELDEADGWMSFERYMQRALYEPGLGYYSAGSTKLGAAGDFVTAPELSAVFGQVLAREIQPVLEIANAPIILELGAGTGRLAESILAALDDDVSRRPEYQILEPSADLAQRQRSRLASFGDQVSWLAQLPVGPSHVPTPTSHGPGELQATAVPSQVPDSQRSVCVHRSPSSQPAPSTSSTARRARA